MALPPAIPARYLKIRRAAAPRFHLAAENPKRNPLRVAGERGPISGLLGGQPPRPLREAGRQEPSPPLCGRLPPLLRPPAPIARLHPPRRPPFTVLLMKKSSDRFFFKLDSGKFTGSVIKISLSFFLAFRTPPSTRYRVSRRWV